MNWPVRGNDGESLGQFHANMREVCDALQDEPESTLAELSDTLCLPKDTVSRAVIQSGVVITASSFTMQSISQTSLLTQC